MNKKERRQRDLILVDRFVWLAGQLAALNKEMEDLEVFAEEPEELFSALHSRIGDDSLEGLEQVFQAAQDPDCYCPK